LGITLSIHQLAGLAAASGCIACLLLRSVLGRSRVLRIPLLINSCFTFALIDIVQQALSLIDLPQASDQQLFEHEAVPLTRQGQGLRRSMAQAVQSKPTSFDSELPDSGILK
jgi:hypothetical protein